MESYMLGTRQEQQKMLREVGYAGFEEMFLHIPGEVMLKEEVNIPSGLSEQTVKERMKDIAGKNVVLRHILRGAGAYNHYILATVSSMTSKREFATVYTPCQTEVNQGVLQLIFEYQTVLHGFTGMDTSNASICDGATAVAETTAMCREGKKTTAYISAATNPGVIEVMKTCCFDSSTKAAMIPEKDGVMDAAVPEEILEADLQSTCLYVWQPSYHGNVEDEGVLGRIVHEADAKYIMGRNPIALAVMKTLAEYKAGTATGDSQSFDMPLALGGPYLGLTTVMAVMAGKFPDRIVDEIADNQGRRALVLTLQTRERHIRHEKASSNVCSNQAWCVPVASVCMTTMGADDMAKAAGQCMSEAHYLRDALKEVGFEPKHDCGFFYELVIVSPESRCTDSTHILRILENGGILSGLPLFDREILWCVTEMNTGKEMDELASAIQEALHRECGQKEVCGS